VSGYGRWGFWQTLYFAARVAAACGQHEALAPMLAELRRLGAELPALRAPGRVDLLLGMQAQQDARLGRWDEAIAAWQQLLDGGDSGDLLGQLAESRVRLAEACLKRGERDRAADVLAPALAAAEAGGLMWVLPHLAALLAEDWGGRIEPGLVLRWQGWVAQVLNMAQPVVPAPGVAPAADELLSARETEVVALIAGGASNKHIARALELSPHTVKRHVANILDKLALNSRSQAAAWWTARVAAQSAAQSAAQAASQTAARPGAGA